MKYLTLIIFLSVFFNKNIYSQCSNIPTNDNPTVKNIVDKSQENIYYGMEWGTVNSSGNFTVQLNNETPENSDQISVNKIDGSTVTRFYHAFAVHHLEQDALLPGIWYRAIITQSAICTVYVCPPSGYNIGNTEPDFILNTNGSVYGATWDPMIHIVDPLWQNVCFVRSEPPTEFQKLNINVGVNGPSILGSKETATYTVNLFGKNPSGFINGYVWEKRASYQSNWTKLSLKTQSISFTMSPSGYDYYLRVSAESRDEKGISQEFRIKYGGLAKESVSDNDIPLEFKLEQNYPNPFNPATQISYIIPDAAFVTMKVYNSLGKEVTVLINKFQPVGFYSVTFNASNLPSGIYFYRITAGNFSETKKMILAK